MSKNLFALKGLIFSLFLGVVLCSNLDEFGCVQKGSNGRCNICKNDYYMNQDNICVWNQESCLIYMTFTGECITFENGTSQALKGAWPYLSKNSFQNSNGVCLLGYFRNQNDVCQRQVPFCIGRNRFGVCSRCQGDYQLVNGKCVMPSSSNTPSGVVALNPEDPYCQSFNLFGQCLKCKQGSQKISFSKQGVERCAPQGYDSGCYAFVKGKIWQQCQSCKLRYTFGNGNGRCQKVSDFCASYNPITGLCIKCRDPANPFPTNGVCQPYKKEVQNCAEYKDGYFCTQCSTGYQLYTYPVDAPYSLCARIGEVPSNVGDALTCDMFSPPYPGCCIVPDCSQIWNGKYPIVW